MNTKPMTPAEVSATPRTDAFINGMQLSHKEQYFDDFDHYFQSTRKLADFARQLETELAEANAEIGRLTLWLMKEPDTRWMEGGTPQTEEDPRNCDNGHKWSEADDNGMQSCVRCLRIRQQPEAQS